MAENGLPPEAVPLDINYRCHPNKMNSTVICILCNNVYHKSDFLRILERKPNTAKYITNVLVVCDKHEFDLTSNKYAHGVILKLKEDSQAKTKVIEKLSRNYRRIEAEYSKLLPKYEGLLEENRMQVDDQDETYEEEDKDNVSALKIENQLLRELRKRKGTTEYIQGNICWYNIQKDTYTTT